MTGLGAIATQLFSAAGHSNAALGATDEEKAEVTAWLDRIGNGEFATETGLKVRAAGSRTTLAQALTSPSPAQTLDNELSTRTFLVGSTSTAADLALFASLHPYIVRSSPRRRRTNSR